MLEESMASQVYSDVCLLTLTVPTGLKLAFYTKGPVFVTTWTKPYVKKQSEMVIQDEFLCIG